MKYPNGPQNEKERLWKTNRKAFVREVIRGERPEQCNSNRDVADSIV